ncbi:MAG TPA: 16S rRNA (guanine(527)-N(7))-methyltransferase RsmG [Candidatus Acidoferrales bacterium]|jgi:16S rRNA (guanine527-N7)-methyltransferase|nr:16S rRNA (guanine(527)-N(7))-methyltransferase RsmG [Candidatus Acidoferrales bacterium]
MALSTNTTIVVYNGNEINAPSAASISAVLAKYKLDLSDIQISQIQCYIACLVFWNQRVSLTSVTSPTDILERHFAESMLGSSIIDRPDGRLADVGTGPGFPGLALKISLPLLQVFLIERNTKKCAFLNEVVRFANLDQVRVIHSDYASIPPSENKIDYITARALGDHKDLLRWAAGRLSQSGKIILWLGTQDSVKLSHTKGWQWEPPMPLPHSQRRVILVGRPIL